MAESVPTARGAHPFAFGAALAACAVVWLWAHPVIAQTPQPQSPAAPAEPAPQPPAAQEAQSKPEGFFDAFDRWSRDFKAKVDEANAKWLQSVEETNAKLKASTDETNAKLKASVDDSNAKWRELGAKSEKAAKDAATAQKEAADAFKNLANTRLIEGRQVCEVAPNGSPDCQTAAEVICKGKGFAIGKSADITTTRKCSARALLERDDSQCRTETVLIKAACQ